MSVLSRLMATLGYEPKRDPMDGKWWGDASSLSMSGVAVSRDAALQLDIVQACLEAIAGPVSTLPIVVHRVLEGGEREPLRNHPLHRLLNDRPNARQTGQEFWDELARHLASYRNCYAEIVPSKADAIGELLPIHPSRVSKIERDNDGTVFYEIKSPNGQTARHRQDTIFHIRKAPLTVDGLAGVPFWETAKEAFGRAIAVEQFGALFFANGGSGGGILKHPGAFKTKEDQQQFLDAWRAGGSGTNRHKDRLLLYGVDYKEGGVRNDEAQFLETLQHCETKLLGLWNMPPHRVQRLARATNNNIEQQSLEFVIHTMAPWLEGIQQACRRDLLPSDSDADVYVEFNLLGLLKGDVKARYEAYARGRQWGWLSINDIRRLENLNGIGDAGDEYLRPLNMVPSGTQEPSNAAVAP